MIDVPDERDLDALISSTYSKKMTPFLQCLKETCADPGEILRLERRDIKDNIITINHPVKGHLPGQIEVSSKLIALLNALPKKQKRIPNNLQKHTQMLMLIKEKSSSETPESTTVRNQF